MHIITCFCWTALQSWQPISMDPPPRQEWQCSWLMPVIWFSFLSPHRWRCLPSGLRKLTNGLAHSIPTQMLFIQGILIISCFKLLSPPLLKPIWGLPFHIPRCWGSSPPNCCNRGLHTAQHLKLASSMPAQNSYHTFGLVHTHSRVPIASDQPCFTAAALNVPGLPGVFNYWSFELYKV